MGAAPVQPGAGGLLHGGGRGEVEGEELQAREGSQVGGGARKFETGRDQAQGGHLGPLGGVTGLHDRQAGEEAVPAAEREHRRVVEDDHLRLPRRPAAMSARHCWARRTSSSVRSGQRFARM